MLLVFFLRHLHATARRLFRTLGTYTSPVAQYLGRHIPSPCGREEKPDALVGWLKRHRGDCCRHDGVAQTWIAEDSEATNTWHYHIFYPIPLGRVTELDLLEGRETKSCGQNPFYGRHCMRLWETPRRTIACRSWLPERHGRFCSSGFEDTVRVTETTWSGASNRDPYLLSLSPRGLALNFDGPPMAAETRTTPHASSLPPCPASFPRSRK
ncbi:hypothetical protein N656DRAFT_188663 [Canariomyces notabilis]|uniref:Uncharacterized protein n=1 Tax=Canariomyces notabilis TaxID=2074819 RepID=A0AAN6QJB2_9PEZI|nr:hypothetical protein N656DRAFT_188663 [Canariomyces arenarius]